MTAADIAPCNADPWYVEEKLSAAERQAGVAPLVQLLGLPPRLTVVLPQGRDAIDSWRQPRRTRPDAAPDMAARRPPDPCRT